VKAPLARPTPALDERCAQQPLTEVIGLEPAHGTRDLMGLTRPDTVTP
jgi:hypothetical protein